MIKIRLTFIIYLFFAVSVFAQYNTNAFLANARKDIINNNFEEAIRKLDVLIQAKIGQYDAYFFRGICKYYLSDYIGAAEDFDHAISYNPALKDALYYRALTKDRLGDHESALKDFDKLIERENGNAQLYIDRAFSKLISTDYIGAVSDCNKAISIQALNASAFLCKGAAENSLAEYDNAIRDYSRALELDPKNENIYVRRGMAKSQTKNYAGAIDDYNQALKMDSGCTFAYYNRAMTELDLHDDKAAMRDYNIVLKFEPRNALTYYNRAVLKMNMKDKKGAIADFDKVLLLSPDNILAIFNRAKLRQDIGAYKDALADYSKTIVLWPYYVEAYYNRAFVKKALNDIVGANQDYILGKSISEMNMRKSPADQVRDSITLSRLSKFDANFDNVDPRNTGKESNIELMDLFHITLKDTAQKSRCYYSLLLKRINKKESKFCFTNSDLHENGTAISTNVDAEMLLQIAIYKTNAQLFNDARMVYDSLLTKDSTDVLAYFSRGVNTCKEMELISLFNDESISLNSKKEQTSRNEKNKGYDKALADFTKSAALSPIFALAYYNRAYVKCKLHDFDGAVKDYERAIKADIDFAEAYYNKGLLLLYIKDDYDACQNLSKAGELGVKQAYAIIKKYCNK